MAYRKCDIHGWIETSEYYPDETGELRCKECDTIVYGYREQPPR